MKILAASQLPGGNDKNDIVDPYVEMVLIEFDPNSASSVKANKDNSMNEYNNNNLPTSESEKIRKKHRTKTIKNNGMNPEWSEELDNTFRFKCVKDTTFLVLKVKDEDKYSEDDDLGRFIIPLRYARQGYRHVFLEGKKGQTIKNRKCCVLLHLKEIKSNK